MSRTRIIWNIIAGIGSIGLSIFASVRTYQRFFECDACTVTEVAIGLSTATCFVLIALWLFTLAYCHIYQLVDEITCAGGKFRFKYGGKLVEVDGHMLLKFNLDLGYDESPEIPTHVFILLKSGPWLCPYTLWKDRVESK